MTVFLICCLVILILLNYLETKKIFSYSNLFHFLWLVIMLTYSLKLYDLYDVSNFAVLLILLGNIFFFAGAFARRRFKYRRIIFFKNQRLERDFSYRSIMIVIIIHLLTSIYFSFRTISFLKQGYAYGFIRNIYQGYTEISFTLNQAEDILRNWVSLPLGTVIPAVVVASLLQKKSYKCCYILFIIDEVLYMFYSQHRAALAFIGVYFVIVIANRWSTVDNKIKIRIIWLSFLSIVSIVLVSNSRFNVGDSSIGRTVYRYICGCIPFFDIKIKEAELYNYQTYGLSFLYGIVTPIESLLGVTPFGKTPFYLWVDSIMLSKEKWIRIGDRTFMNAYATIFYDFYLDFKTPGVCLGSMFFGYMIENAYKRFANFNNTKDLAISLTYSVAIVMSMVRWQFGSASFFMAFIYFAAMSYISIPEKRRR